MWEMGPHGQKLLAEKRLVGEDSRDTARVGKRKWKSVSSWLASSNMYSVLCPEKLDNKISYHNTEGVRDIQRTL